MPSIPIQNITDLAAGSVTGNETVPVVQQLGGNYYTYKTPIKNFFYNNAIPFRALSSCPLKWTSSGVLSATNNLIVDNFIGIGTNLPSNRLTVEGTNTLYNSGLNIKPNTLSPTKRAGITLDGWTLGQDANGNGTKDFFIYEREPSNTTRFYVQSGTGRVGIGTTNPSSSLDVSGTITLSQNSNSLRFTDTSGTFPQLAMQSDNNFVFYGTNSTGGNRAVYSIIQRSNTSSFNFNVPVGIGRSADIFNLDVQGAIRATAASNEGGRLVVGNTIKTGSGVADWAIWNMTGQYANGLAFWKYLANGTNGDSTLFLSDSANGAIGIGAGFRTPTAPLHVRADTGNPVANGIRLENVKTTATDDAIVGISTNGANSGDPKVSWDIAGVIGWSAGIDNSDGDKFKIANHWNDLTDKTRMVIGATGNTSFLLDGFTEAMVARPPGWGGGVSTWDVWATSAIGAGPAGSNPRAYLNSAGTVAGITFNSSSSVRFKKDIEPLKDSLANIQKLRGVRYNWKETEKADIGLIAEEVNEVYPEIVKKDDDGVPEGIDYGKLTAVLIETVKELTQKIEELERKVK
jgi:hypothetical protein